MNQVEREFQFSDANFQFLKWKIKQLAGINLADTKNELVYSRISRLLRLNHLKSFDEYCERLNQNIPDINNEFINAITTNFTSFIRESHHFDYLRQKILPELFQLNAYEKRIRIWSAGCSTGEEPYSISFVVNDMMLCTTFKIYHDIPAKNNIKRALHWPGFLLIKLNFLKYTFFLKYSFTQYMLFSGT